MIDGVEFDSRFDSGSLLKVEENITIMTNYKRREFNIWVADDKPDADENEQSTAGWFHFSVRKVK